MEEEKAWSRGRPGWGSEGGGRGVREGSSHSPRRTHHSGSPSHKYRPSRPVWDDTVHDLASMRLSPAELARKLASRQSSNKVIARAQLLEHTRRSGSQGLSLPPTLAARLQARQQSVDTILAQSNATLVASQKVRHSEASATAESRSSKDTDGDKIHDGRRSSRDEILENLHRQQDRFGHLTNDTDSVNTVKSDTETERSRLHKFTINAGNRAESARDLRRRELQDDAKKEKQKEGRASSSKDAQKPVDVRQLAATRTSLDHTITMVVNTCRELWMQLEEERLTREHLQRQLQQQGNIITNLTSELLLIQDQQEAIIQEVSDARTSGLWGLESDLTDGIGGCMVGGGEELLGSQSLIDMALGVKSSPHSASGRHPQRSILRATRTIHTPQMRQSPPYQLLQQTGRSHQANTHLPSSQQPPPSPRHHQPSPLAHPQTHQPSPPPEPSLSQPGHASSRPDPHMMANYRSTVSRQIRDTLVSEQVAASAHDRSNNATPLSFVGSDELHETVATEEDMRALGDNQPIAVANKENFMMSGMDPALVDHRERK